MGRFHQTVSAGCLEWELLPEYTAVSVEEKLLKEGSPTREVVDDYIRSNTPSINHFWKPQTSDS